jgi:hypothetical protein
MRRHLASGFPSRDGVYLTWADTISTVIASSCGRSAIGSSKTFPMGM